jgi:hypothetical protein
MFAEAVENEPRLTRDELREEQRRWENMLVGLLADGKVWKEQAQNLLLISLYETHMRRAVEKDITSLQAMQE